MTPPELATPAVSDVSDDSGALMSVESLMAVMLLISVMSLISVISVMSEVLVTCAYPRTPDSCSL